MSEATSSEWDLSAEVLQCAGWTRLVIKTEEIQGIRALLIETDTTGLHEHICYWRWGLERICSFGGCLHERYGTW